MEELKQHKFALSFIGLLVIARFIILPLLEWQDGMMTDISLLKNKSERIDNVLAGRDQTSQYLQDLQKIVRQRDKLFLPIENDSSFQLQRQQWLEQKMAEHNLTMNNIGWLPSQPQEEVDVRIFSAQLNLKGKTVDVIAFIQDIQSQTNYIAVQSLNMGLRFHSDGNIGNAQTRLNLRFHGRKRIDS